MSPEEQHQVRKAYDRHIAMCEKAGVAPEIGFLHEYITDLSKGLIDPK